MAHIVRTPAGTWRANWRDPAGRQRAKTFKTKKEAARFVAEIEASRNRGLYIDPHAGKVRFADYLPNWVAGRHDERTTTARDQSIMRTHIIPRWGQVPLVSIDHSSVQGWIADLSTRRSPATVRQCFRLFSSVLKLAVRDRLIGHNPCEGVTLPKQRRKDTDERTISREAFVRQLLPEVPSRYRALVALAGGTGMRWGEVVGMRWDAIDLELRQAYVVRVATEVAGKVVSKPFPKSRAGRRELPLPDFAARALVIHGRRYRPGRSGEVFTNEAGGPMRRTLFRARVWRPALVRAGLLGKVVREADDRYRASWTDVNGHEQNAILPTENLAVVEVARKASGGLRFHDLRHSYATWLVSDGVPVNDVQRLMGHERPSTTLDLYTHRNSRLDSRVGDLFADFSLTSDDDAESSDPPNDSGDPC